MSPEHLARLLDQYVHAFRQYQLAKHAADKAEAARNAACNACEAAHADEVNASRAVVRASKALQAASDAAFLTQHGISTC
ncbi:MAG: hypothetical protein JO268_16290 [Pseudonocardiales bacterium]|nr:hypothetical protein [Pseudonocardiales bacterium]